jgi:hypothetical protein
MASLELSTEELEELERSQIVGVVAVRLLRALTPGENRVGPLGRGQPRDKFGKFVGRKRANERK